MKSGLFFKNLIYCFIVLVLALIGCDSGGADGGNRYQEDLPEGAYTLSVINNSGGVLQNVEVGTQVCSKVSPGGACIFTNIDKPTAIPAGNFDFTHVYTVTDKPAAVTLKKESASSIGAPFDEEIEHTTGSGKSETKKFDTPDGYYALWIKNNSTGIIDKVSVNWNGSAYEETHNLSAPVTNDGFSHFVGFVPTSWENIHLGDATKPDPLEYDGISPVENNGTRTHTLVVDSDGLGNEEWYTFTLKNNTGGMLSNVYIGPKSCETMDAGDTCMYTYASKPASITIQKESASDIGTAFSDDIVYTPGSESSKTYTLDTPGGYYALWIKNNSIYALDAIDFYEDVATYVAGWTLIPVPNDGLFHYMGFVLLSWDYVELLDTVDDRYWPYGPIVPVNNNGAVSHILIAN